MKSRIKKTVSSWLTRGPMNYNLLFAILFLNIYGLIMIYSSSYYSATSLNLPSSHFVTHQAEYLLIGLVAMYVVSKIDYHIWMKMGWIGYGVAIILVVLLKTKFGVGALGAIRWLEFGPIRFQAAEPIKLFMMVFYAMYMAEYGLTSPGKRLVAWVLAGVMGLLLGVVSDNMSTAIIIVGICYIIFMVSQKRIGIYWKVIAAIVVLVAVVLLAIEFVLPITPGENFRITRIRAFLHPEEYTASTGLQAQQALYAIGAGGFWGQGLGQSLVKFKLSEPYNDYILAIICEEMGVFGACLLLFLYGYLFTQIVKVERIACDVEGKIFCTGVFAQVAIQTILNVMVVVNWFPTTGVSLPFISYGGASAIFLLIEFGVVFNIDKVARNRKYHYEAVKQINKEEERRKHY
ncbi:MAG: FtsW/RodA/SpoVE family cell cycle protein [Lachnospiraceae bacterium]|nr:FtsW/RodA/SpoVE family cell cycle protein [Lachnospiraceae bacterium]